jgi:flagellar protein FlaJ
MELETRRKDRMQDKEIVDEKKSDKIPIAKKKIAKKAHLVKLPMPHQYTDIKHTDYRKLAYKIFRKSADKYGKNNHILEKNLNMAHMRTTPEWYLAETWMSTILAAIVGVVISSVLTLVLRGLPAPYTMLFGVLPIILAVGVYLYYITAPSSNAKSRGRDIEKRLPYAMSFISAMASANVNLDVIFKELSEEKVYGEVANEAAYITRDVYVFKKDILTALRDAIDRCPSTRLHEFFQGVIVTSTSGGKLKPYFVMKSEQYMKQNAIDQKGFLETLGMLAETFVTVVVAFPLFLVVLMSIMSVIGGSTASSIQLLYIVVFLMIPLSQFGFIFSIKTLSEGRT